MKLRYFFIFTFSLVALVPATLFWIWPYSKALESETNEVKERHLLIAKNLSTAFERYYTDVTSIFVLVEDGIKKDNKSIQTLFTNFGYQTIMEVSKDRKVQKCLIFDKVRCRPYVSAEILELALKTLKKDAVTLSIVTEDVDLNTGPIFLAVKKREDNIIIGYLSTNYIIQSGKKVIFGDKGHAAIVDQEGNVIAHPLDSWIQDIKNISKISVVQKMLAGKSGVEIFYSPALKADMIAGYTAVKNAHWGVMVPQPYSELKQKAKEIDQTAVLVMVIGLGLALLIIIPISLIIIQPIERLSKMIKTIDNNKMQKKIKLNIPNFLPLEIKNVKNSFVTMINTLQENKKDIAKLAYFDHNTGLPNRNYFDILASKALYKMEQSNNKGALVFIDFDGFKNINDTYGHHIGDELLFLFGRRLLKYFLLKKTDESQFLSDKNVVSKVIPSRLGGDEFLILFNEIENEKILKKEIEDLFQYLFSKYELSNNIELTLKGSVGISMYPKDATEYKSLIKSADMAMYDAKKLGKNMIKFYS